MRQPLQSCQVALIKVRFKIDLKSRVDLSMTLLVQHV